MDYSSPNNLFSKKNLISYLIMAILVVAIPIAVKLVQTQQQLKSKATGDVVTVLEDDHTKCPTQDSCTTSSTTVQLKLTSPFGAGGTSSVTPPPPPPAGNTSFPIGVGIDSSTLDWWNSKAKSTDFVVGSLATLNAIPTAKGIKLLMVDPTNPASDMDTAKANGWNMVTSNIENSDINCVIGGGTCSDGTTVAYGEKAQYQMAKSRGLTFTFGPTGRQLSSDWATTYNGQDHALLRNADIMAYQTESLQDVSGFSIDQYAAQVKDLIGKIKPYTAKNQVRVQVSINPPGNRCTTSADVINYIDSITTGSNTPDGVVIFVSPSYDSQCSEKRVDVMKQVVGHYR